MLYFWEIQCFAVGHQERKCKCEVRVCSKGAWQIEPRSVQTLPAEHPGGLCRPGCAQNVLGVRNLTSRAEGDVMSQPH